MARTESISIQVHPFDEQSQIDLMEKFHWSLLGSQTIDRVDTNLERRGDALYAVRTEESYVKLQFSRDLTLPHLSEIKRLEQEFNALPWPSLPTLFPGGFLLWFILLLLWLSAVVIWPIYYFAFYTKNKAAAETIRATTTARRRAIIAKLEELD